MPSPSVLLVEPNDDSRLIYSVTLRHSGYGVTESRDCAEAVALARALAPGLVVLGVSDPQHDAWAALAALASTPATAGIPVLAVSSSAFPADRDRAMALGCAEFLAKPCPPAQLAAAARRHLPA